MKVEEAVLTLQSEVTQREKDAASSFLYTRFQKGLNFYLLKLMRKKEDAEDVAQTVWSKVFDNINQYDEAHSFTTWLYKIAKNQFIDTMRKGEMRTLSLDDVLSSDTEDSITFADMVVDKENNPIQAIESNENVALCNEILSRLSPVNKEVITLRHINELSYEEIANKLNVPLGTVKGRISRARLEFEQVSETYNIAERLQ